MSPIYEFEHPKTGEIFEDIRSIEDRDKLFISEDGAKCKRVFCPSRLGYCGKGDRECFELDRDYVKKVNPKRVKYRDGHSETYDPTRHC
jgi:hypothetical protein